MKLTWFMLGKWDFGTPKRAQWISKGSQIFMFSTCEEKWGPGGCLRKTTNVDKKSMRKGDVPGSLNEAKALLCWKKNKSFYTLRKNEKMNAKGFTKDIQIELWARMGLIFEASRASARGSIFDEFLIGPKTSNNSKNPFHRSIPTTSTIFKRQWCFNHRLYTVYSPYVPSTAYATCNRSVAARCWKNARPCMIKYRKAHCGLPWRQLILWLHILPTRCNYHIVARSP